MQWQERESKSCLRKPLTRRVNCGYTVIDSHYEVYNSCLNLEYIGINLGTMPNNPVSVQEEKQLYLLCYKNCMRDNF